MPDFTENQPHPLKVLSWHTSDALERELELHPGLYGVSLRTGYVYPVIFSILLYLLRKVRTNA